MDWKNLRKLSRVPRTRTTTTTKRRVDRDARGEKHVSELLQEYFMSKESSRSRSRSLAQVKLLSHHPASPRKPLTYLLVLIRPLITPEITSQKSSAKARKGGTSVIEGLSLKVK
jgi:hypothetical protein